MSDPYEFIPPFVSPLTHDEHARLGRIAVLWGQIDMVLDMLLEVSMGLSPKQRKTLIGEKPIGAKLDMLKLHLDDIKTTLGRTYATAFWDLANQTKTQRNRCFHGVWGFRCGKPGEVRPSATHFKDGGSPVRITQLAPLEKKLCKTARVGMNALQEISPAFQQFKQPGAGLLFHGSDKDAPPWLPKWIEQHPVDDRSLDRRHKQGQLPYLRKPL